MFQSQDSGIDLESDTKGRNGHFICSLCDTKYSTKDSLGRHIKSVHVKKRLKCLECQSKRTFNSKDALNMHQLRKHGVVTCDDCGLCFSETKWYDCLQIRDGESVCVCATCRNVLKL